MPLTLDQAQHKLGLAQQMLARDPNNAIVIAIVASLIAQVNDLLGATAP